MRLLSTNKKTNQKRPMTSYERDIIQKVKIGKVDINSSLFKVIEQCIIYGTEISDTSLMFSFHQATGISTEEYAWLLNTEDGQEALIEKINQLKQQSSNRFKEYRDSHIPSGTLRNEPYQVLTRSQQKAYRMQYDKAYKEALSEFENKHPELKNKSRGEIMDIFAKEGKPGLAEALTKIEKSNGGR